MTMIYTIGYRQPNVEEQLTQLVADGYRIVDIRRRAGSRYRADYNLLRLAYRFGSSYHRLRELGNENYRKPSAPVALADQETGIQKALRVINEYTDGRGIILLCACEDWQKCHRSYVADLLLERLPSAEIVHIHSDNTYTRVAHLEGEHGS